MTPDPLRITCLAPSPVFYQVPLYRTLASRSDVDLEVAYLSDEGIRPYSAGFGDAQSIAWDTDLLSGYRHRMLPGAASASVSGGARGLSLRGVGGLVQECAAAGRALWVHGWSYTANILAIVQAKSRGVPLLLREEQTLLHRRPAPRSWARAVALHTILRGAQCMYIGSNNQDFFLRYGASEDRLHFVPYCSDLAGIEISRSRDKSLAVSLRKSLAIAADDAVVVVVGKLEEKKAPDMVLQAFDTVRSEIGSAHLVFVGTGLDQSRLANMAAGSPWVHFSGFVNRAELGQYYELADVTVLASQFHETWGLVVNESLARGVPVLASDKVGSARDLLKSDLVFPHRDGRALADMLRIRLGDRDGTHRLGAALAERARHWNHEVAADGVVAAASMALRGSRTSHLQPGDVLGGLNFQPGRRDRW